MSEISISRFFEDKKESLMLSLLAGKTGLDRLITRQVVQRPSFILTGWTLDFAEKRVQILGKTEMNYLENLPPNEANEAIKRLMSYPIPAVIIANGISPPPFILENADKAGIPLFVSGLTTEKLFSKLTIYLDAVFSPKIATHGTMMDVYGVGILYTGRAGIGKSECALDLVERGHRLVADDTVYLTRRADGVLMARGAPGAGHHIEIRGVGIIDIERLFGVRAIRIQKRVELEVHLELWEVLKDYERLGLDDTKTTYLNVELPKITIPISPGKNITAISEVIAMNHMLKVYGHHPAREFIARLQEKMRREKITEQYLESDFE